MDARHPTKIWWEQIKSLSLANDSSVPWTAERDELNYEHFI